MARFVQIAIGPGAELSCYLLLARELELIDAAEYSALHEGTSEVLRMLSALSERVRQTGTNEHAELRAKG